jgi:hypothetical protein
MNHIFLIIITREYLIYFKDCSLKHYYQEYLLIGVIFTFI